jgi:sugar lactone lactonase YvrE
MSFVEPSTLLMIGRGSTRGCTVYTLDLAQEGATPQNVTGVPDALPETKLMIPVGIHNMMSVLDDLMENRDYIYRGGSNTAVVSVLENSERLYYYAPGTKIAVKAGGTWRPLPQSSNMAAFSPGDKFYVACEDDGKTYRVKLNKNETLTYHVFAERGGNSAIEDSTGNVYIASDQVYIYNSDGEQIGVLEIPERPGSLTFGGPDNRTLFIGARSSVYSIRTVNPG